MLQGQRICTDKNACLEMISVTIDKDIPSYLQPYADVLVELKGRTFSKKKSQSEEMLHLADGPLSRFLLLARVAGRWPLLVSIESSQRNRH